MPGHHHRAGGLRQKNKRNKRSNSSKRSVARAAGGKIMKRGSMIKATVQQSRTDRRNQAAQKRASKKEELLRKKRGIGASSRPPRLVGVVGLGSDAASFEQKVISHISSSADVAQTSTNGGLTTCHFKSQKKDGHLSFLSCRAAFARKEAGDHNQVLAALDIARVCDLLLFVIDGDEKKQETALTGLEISGEASTTSSSMGSTWDHLISPVGDSILSALKAQGLPTTVTALCSTKGDEEDDVMTMQSMKSLRRSETKRQLDLKRFVSRFATTEFSKGSNKVIAIDLCSAAAMQTTEEEKPQCVNTLVRTLCSMAASPARWVADVPRSYIVAESRNYREDSQELDVTGFIRGASPFDVNQMIHVPGLGTYNVRCVMEATASDNSSHFSKTVTKSENTERESGAMFAEPHALDGEQNLVGFEEDMDVDMDIESTKVPRPAGWSDYQAAWFDGVADGSMEGMDHGELAESLNKKEVDTDDIDDVDMGVSASEREALRAKRLRDKDEDAEFPDEIQLDENTPARDRFARYRSIKSFRKSVWDPKESLPPSYSTIYNFSNFRATQKGVMNDIQLAVSAAGSVNGNFWGGSEMEAMSNDDGLSILGSSVPTGSFVTLTLVGVTKEQLASFQPSLTMVAVLLLRHENKVSVVHMDLSPTRSAHPSAPVKSKDTLTFRCGWRTWQGRPIFSQHNLNCDKHKFERFMPEPGVFFAASTFGPATYTPCPVLVFRENGEFIASGSVMSVDADRVVVKRIILTGYPVRVHKRTCTVKYMFYNPEDVRWFKPAGLYTKHGLQGNIEESVGEHGTMKCLFNAPIKQHDTVCLPLYKRVFPKLPRSDQTKNPQQKPQLHVW